MSALRTIFLLCCLTVAAVSPVRADDPGYLGDADTLVIVLEHHWVVELAGQRFGLIQFDTPSTTILLGGFDFDLPVRVSVVVVPLIALPALIATAAVLQARRRRFAFEV